ncbi:hypothetical protein BC830DRAFT_1124704 [Chytriomyces sp. MP71]|nr:hypothetical protein BC830DRAFT_1136721 [Chytriomyces sp. MP71]KAI8614996.1 hypothetical protein BC830DRAFT_1124704 [Chytriomyces sp. MP71]
MVSSYRVATDAELAERLADKLQQLPVLNEQREMRIRCFLDKQNLKAGSEYTKQFLEGLNGSCLFLPLVSEQCMRSMMGIQEGWNDSVVCEWQTALKLMEKEEIAIVPLLVGSIVTAEGASAYRRFNGFALTNQLPESHIANAPSTLNVRETVSQLFKLQGIFINPMDVVDKLGAIQSRFSAEVWPAFRGAWEDQTQLGPEPRFNCVQCMEQFAESANGEGSCRFHLSDGPLQKFGRQYTCCGLSDPKLGCATNKHRQKHHNDWEYGAFYNWRYAITGFVNTHKELAVVAADDFKHSAFPNRTVYASIGATLDEAPIIDQDKLTVNAHLPGKSWFMTFSPEDLRNTDYAKPIVKLVGTKGEWVIATWLVDSAHNEIVGAKLQCGTASSLNPSSVTVRFNWPTISEKNGPVASSVEFSKSLQFGEKALPPSAVTSTKANPYHLPATNLFSGRSIPRVVVRKRDDTLPRWNSPKSPLRLKVTDCSTRHDSYKNDDIFTANINVMNTSKDPIMIAEGKCFARLRVGKDAVLAFPSTSVDDDGVITSDWKEMEKVYFGIGQNATLPATVNGSGVLALTMNVRVSTKRYEDAGISIDNKFYSWLVYRAGAPVVMDIELQDINGDLFGAMAEFCMPDMGLSEPDARALFSLPIDDAQTAERQIAQVLHETEETSEIEVMDPAYLRVQRDKFTFRIGYGTGFGVSTLRHIVLSAEEHKKSNGELGIADITELCVSGVKLPYTDYNNNQFQTYVHALIDFSRRCVVAIRLSCSTRSMRCAGYFVVPPYGDALDAENVTVEPLAVLDVSNANVANWKKDEAEMVSSVDVTPAVEQAKVPVLQRVLFDSGAVGIHGGAPVAAQIDPAVLESIVRPIVAEELAKAIPEITRSVEATFQKGMDRLFARIAELEVEREEERRRFSQVSSSSHKTSADDKKGFLAMFKG